MILVEIWEANFVLDKGFTAIRADDRIIQNRVRGTLAMTDPALFTEIPNPLVIIAFIER
jgi:hypothetical protein